MATRGFLIRFIDIGLIVLFGFLMISDIDAMSRVDLAGARQEVAETAEVTEDDERGFIVVDILPDGRFLLSDPRDPGAVSMGAENLETLTTELVARHRVHTEAGTETVVLIQPDPASPVQFTVDVMDVCDRLGLVKSLQMDIEVASPTDEEPS
ncbi:MAG: biopolymer transporter ExbD [Longimicrobiales bacterium]|nr:biopolymer transporter ExbD [Longimicrobiales bacterium]